MRILKSSVKRLSAGIPYKLKLQILRFLAILPPQYRSRIGYLYASYLSSFVPPETIFWTNMGISKEYRCQIPLNMESCAIWGKPEFHLHENNSMLLASILSNQADAFVDVGSYVGYYVFWVRNQLDEHKPIYYFEPIPDHYGLIQQNILANNLSNIHPSHYALGNQDGVCIFYKNLTYASCGSLTPHYVDKHEVTQIEVPITTFSSFFKSENLQSLCVKVDVEGAEQMFIDGAKDLITKIHYLIIEVLDPQSGFLGNMRSEYGFEVYHVLSNGLRYCQDGIDEYVHNQWNWLLCRLEPAELQTILGNSGLKVLDTRAE